MAYLEQYTIYKQKLEKYIKSVFEQEKVLQQTVLSAMEYSIMNGGKRLRGILVMHCAEIFGSDMETSLPVAAAIEMVHAYSLIHDDLPCMDNDDFRRGMPSCHKAFDEATALLAGDALLTLAFEKISDANISSDKKVKLIKLLSNSAGAYGMIGGQQIDLESENKDISIEILTTLHRLKTGALIKAAVGMGCILGNCSDDDYKKMQEYAENVGLAFQITDDMLDVTANEEELGKPINSDSKNNKTTFVTKYGYEKSRELATQLIAKAVDNLYNIDVIKEKEYFLKELAEKIIDRRK